MKILVRNLDRNVTDVEILDLFKAYGKVESCVVVKDEATGKSKGFGFVEMPDDEAALKAIEELNGAEVNGRSIVVNKSEERREGAPRRTGGGGGGFNRGGDRGGDRGGFNRGGGGGDRRPRY